MAILTLTPSRNEASLFLPGSYAYVFADGPVRKDGVMVTPQPISKSVAVAGVMTFDLIPNSQVDENEEFRYTVSAYSPANRRLYTYSIVMPITDTNIFDLVEEDLSMTLAELQQQVDDLESSFATLSATVSGHTTEFASVNAAITQLQTNLTAEINARTALASVVGTIQGDVGDLQVRQMFMSFTNEAIADNTRGVEAQLAESFEILALGNRSYINTPPSGGPAQWEIRKNGVAVITISWADGSNVGVWDVISGDDFVLFEVDDIFAVYTGVQNGLQGVSLTALVREGGLGTL